jgi:HSP20 family protein
MSIKDLAIWNRKKEPGKESGNHHSIDVFQDGFKHMISNFFRDDWGLPSNFFGNDRFSSFSPVVNVSENRKSVDVAAELPGLSDKDIQVSLHDDVLTIKGEKKVEKESKDNNYHKVERSYGSFQRSIQLPCEVEADKIKASHKNGILKIEMPKSAKARKNSHFIEVKSA